MNRLFLGLRSSTGDEPGNVREVLDHVSSIERVSAVSDLHYALSHNRTSTDEYGIALVLDSDRTTWEVVTALRSLVSQTASRMPSSAQFGADIEVLLESGDGRGATVGPVLLVALESIADEQKREGRRVRELAQALPQHERERIVRIPRTAVLAPVRTLDYDAIGDAKTQYHEVRPLSRFDVEIFERTKEAVGLHEDMRAMDVGCGTGRFSLLLAHAGAAVTGVDKSENMLAVARSDPRALRARIEYVLADANHLLLPGPFDVVTFFFSVQYMDLDPDFWRRLRDSLAVGGSVAFVTFPHVHFAQTQATQFFPSIASIDMARFPSIPRLCRLMVDNGFDDVVVRDVVWHEEIPPQTLISRTAARYLSTFHLLSSAEFESGLAAMREAYATVETVERTIRASVVRARRRHTTTHEGLGKASR